VLEELLDPNFHAIGSSGRLWTRSEVLRALEATDPDGPGIEASEMEAGLVGDKLVLVTYLSSRAGCRARRSSLGRQHSGGSWPIVFHQAPSSEAVTRAGLTLTMGEAQQWHAPGFCWNEESSLGPISIGDFARLTRLSQKALRLYDELGLLPPARVDPTRPTASLRRASSKRRAWWRCSVRSASRSPRSRSSSR
jgi:hypothetical protein